MDKEYFFITDQLVVWRPVGMLEGDKIQEFIKFLNLNSEIKGPHFDRFVDLSETSGISVRYDDIYPIVKQREAYFGTHLKSKVKLAVLANNPLSFGVARMYQQLSDNSQIEIGVFETPEDASNFLEVDISIISP